MSSEMFGKYSAVFLGKISVMKYCRAMRRHKERLSLLCWIFFHVCMLYQIIACGPEGQYPEDNDRQNGKSLTQR